MPVGDSWSWGGRVDTTTDRLERMKQAEDGYAYLRAPDRCVPGPVQDAKDLKAFLAAARLAECESTRCDGACGDSMEQWGPQQPHPCMKSHRRWCPAELPELARHRFVQTRKHQMGFDHPGGPMWVWSVCDPDTTARVENFIKGA
eukprot:7384240-Prymnesium_polylepis.1